MSMLHFLILAYHKRLANLLGPISASLPGQDLLLALQNAIQPNIQISPSSMPASGTVARKKIQDFLFSFGLSPLSSRMFSDPIFIDGARPRADLSPRSPQF